MKRSEYAVVTGVYTVLALFSFGRLWNCFQSAAVVGSPFDFGTNVWFQWWGPFAIGKGINPFFTRMMYYPVGELLTVDAWVTQWLLCYPLQKLLSPLGRYNFLAALSYVATGVASYAFTRTISRSREGCFLASLAITFSPFRVYQFAENQSELLQTQWAVFMIATYMAMLNKRSDRKAWLLAAAASCLAVYNDLRTFAMALMFIVAFTAVLAVERRRMPDQAAVLFTTGALLLAAPLIAMCLHVLHPWKFALTDRPPGSITRMVEFRQFAVPPAMHALRMAGVLAPANPMPEFNEAYISPIVLVLALAGAIAARGRRWGRSLAIMTLLFAGLEFSRWPLNRVPFLSFLKTPARFSFLVSIGTGALMSLGWPILARRLPSPRIRFSAWIGLCLIVVVEMNPLWLAPTPVDFAGGAALDALARDPGRGGVIDLPLQQRFMDPTVVNASGFIRAMRHQRPLMNGGFSVLTQEVFGHFESNADIIHLLECQAGRGCVGFDAGYWRRLRASEDIGYVICDRSQETPFNEFVRRSPALRPVADSEGISVYALPGP